MIRIAHISVQAMTVVSTKMTQSSTSAIYNGKPIPLNYSHPQFLNLQAIRTRETLKCQLKGRKSKQTLGWNE